MLDGGLTREIRDSVLDALSLRNDALGTQGQWAPLPGGLTGANVMTATAAVPKESGARGARLTAALAGTGDLVKHALITTATFQRPLSGGSILNDALTMCFCDVASSAADIAAINAGGSIARNLMQRVVGHEVFTGYNTLQPMHLDVGVPGEAAVIRISRAQQLSNSWWNGFPVIVQGVNARDGSRAPLGPGVLAELPALLAALAALLHLDGFLLCAEAFPSLAGLPAALLKEATEARVPMPALLLLHSRPVVMATPRVARRRLNSVPQ